MAKHNILMNTFADARRTWDELIGLQPDIKSGSGNLFEADLVELQRRVEAHRIAVDFLEEAIESERADASPGSDSASAPTGVHRESPHAVPHER